MRYCVTGEKGDPTRENERHYRNDTATLRHLYPLILVTVACRMCI